MHVYLSRISHLIVDVTFSVLPNGTVITELKKLKCNTKRKRKKKGNES